MTSLLLAFGWSVLFAGISDAKPTDPSPTQSAQNIKHMTSLAADDKQEKRSFVINGDYYAGPSREIETLLRAIQAQLSEMQKQLQDLKPVTENKTGEGEEELRKAILFRYFLCYRMNREVFINQVVK